MPTGFHFDEDDFKRQIEAQLQTQVNAELQAGVRAVRDRMNGCGDPQAVHAALVSEMHDRFGDGFHAGDNMQQVADAIADGTLED